MENNLTYNLIIEIIYLYITHQNTLTMKKLIFLAIILFLTVNSYSQWVYQNCIDSVTNISSGSFINSNTGWYARSKGQISKTTDGGISWNTYDVDANDLNSIKFVNANTGYVCGNNGRLLKSINGGLNWSIQNPSSTDTLVSIDFVNELTGWCAGRDFIVNTTNGGSQWYRQNIDTSIVKPRFTVLKMYDSQNGLAGAYRKNANDMYAYIYRTSNGGVSWQFQDSVYGYRIYSICYVNQSIVYLSNYKIVYKSINGGITWTNSSTLPMGTYSSKIQFIDENNGYYVQSNGIFRTTSGGSSWNFIFNGYFSDYIDLNKIDNTIYAATKKGSVIKLIGTENSWLNYSINMENENWLISFADASNIFIGSKLGALWKTSNGGLNWQINFRDSTEEVIFPVFPNQNTGFLLSPSNTIYKTTNTGINWLKLPVNFDKHLYTISYSDENNIWVGGDSGYVMCTTNSGNSWVEKSAVGDNRIYRIFPFGNTIYLYFFNKIKKSTDSGNNWIELQIDTLSFGFYSYFLNSQTGWAIPTMDTTIYKTVNGGINWVKYTKSVRNNLPVLNPFFVNNNTGFSATSANNYQVLKTTNSGLSWCVNSDFPNLTSVSLNAVFFNSNTGLVVGTNGLILKTTNGGTSFISVNNQNIPYKFSLAQNYPNPFNPATIIKFKIKDSHNSASSANVKLVVFDILGKEIATLVNENLKPGEYEPTFDARGLTSGIYFYRLTAGDFSETKKMLMIK